MFPASTTAGGMGFAFPDTCNTPAPPSPSPVPIPYPNMAQLNMALAPTCSMVVKIENMAVVTKNSQVPMTQGDEAGVNVGLTSGTVMGPASFKAGVATVKIEGNDIINMLKTCGQNGSSANAPGGAIVTPSQVKVIVNG